MNRLSSTTALIVLVVAGFASASSSAQERAGIDRRDRMERYEELDRHERDATREEWDRVADHLRSLGYSRISDVDVTGDLFEADAISPEGREVDVYLDRTSLRVLSVRRS